MSNFIIYGLVDPRTNVVRYVGKSTHGLKRPHAHCYIGRKAGTPKAAWIRSLQRAGLRYIVRVLEEFDGPENLNGAECFWIAQARGLGWPLTNLTKGGDGFTGTADARAKVSRAMLNIPAETRAKISEALRRKNHALARTRAQAEAENRLRERRARWAIEGIP